MHLVKKTYADCITIINAVLIMHNCYNTVGLITDINISINTLVKLKASSHPVINAEFNFLQGLLQMNCLFLGVSSSHACSLL